MNKDGLIDELGEVIYVSDPDTYELLFANAYGMKVMGTENYIGQKCYRLIQGLDHPCDFCTNRWLSFDNFYVWEYTNTKVQRHFLLKDKLIRWDGRKARLEIALDITERENVSQKVEKKLKTEHALVECIRALTAAGDLASAMNAVLASVGDFYRADRSYILELDEDRSFAAITFEWCAAGVRAVREDYQRIPMAAMPLWKRAMDKQSLVCIGDIEGLREEYPLEYERLRRQGIGGIIAAPFMVGEENLGFIGVDAPADNTDDPSLLQSLSYFVINEMVKRRMQEELAYRSSHDGLTGVYNRFQYLQYLRTANAESLDSMGVVFCDINGLKKLNEAYGHHYGDTVIAGTAETLKECFPNEHIYRLSGDEFVVLCENVDNETFTCMVQKAQEQLDNGQSDGVSIGYTWDNVDIDLNRLARHADELMYVNKQTYYRNNPRASGKRRPRMLTELLHALEHGEFKMYLQPKADIQTEKIIGAEALVRHIHPTEGMVPPDRFIPVLEKEKTIKYIDLFIFEEVCRTLEIWQQRGIPLIPISVNFSRITMMETGLMDRLGKICRKYSFPRQLIEIEITESVGDLERQIVADIGMELKKEGFLISLDDFGSKFSSMSMMTIMDLDVLKLDRSLINDLVNNEKNRVLVRQVISMCEDLKITSIAEGVETRDQLELLRTLRCNQAQGFLFSRPVPLDVFEENFLQSNMPAS